VTELGSLESLPVAEPFPGLRRRSFDSAGATVNEYAFEPGARFPLHRHPQEQVTLVLEGEVEMTIDGRVSTLAAGAWSVVAPDVEHSITAGPQGARILAILVPRRSAADAYTVIAEATKRPR
jgi:quercetin dioxygenase-like cupin family protein